MSSSLMNPNVQKKQFNDQVTSLGVDFDDVLEPAESFPLVNISKETPNEKVDGLLITHNIE